ncbi:MAG: hypothetical protein ACO3ND_06550 [Opitutales bacterium]
MRPLLLSIFLALAALAHGAGDAAQEAYDRGEYAEAARLWEERAARDGVDSGLLAALGNAEWRLGRKGRAVLCWERALLLDPEDPVALAGVRHARNAGGAERPAATWSEDYASLLPSGAWALLAAGALWAGAASLLIPRLAGRRQGASAQRLLLGAVTALVLCGPGVWGSYTRSERSVVRRSETSLRLTPTAEGEPVSVFTEGDVVRAGRGFNGHVRVRTSDGRVGWVRSGEIERIEGGGLPSRTEPGAP